MIYAHIVDGRVASTVELAEGFDPAELFPEMTYVACSEQVLPGWRYDGSDFQAPSAAPVSQADLLAYAAYQRWRKEVGGVVWDGIPIATDDRSKTMIIGARLAAEVDPSWSTIWHGTDSAAYPVDAIAMVAISDRVQAHVNATFASFASLKVAIESGAVTTHAEIDAAYGDAEAG